MRSVGMIHLSGGVASSQNARTQVVHLVMLPPWFSFSVVLVVMMMRNVPGVQSKRGSPGHDSSLCLSSVAFLLRSCL